MEAISKFDIKFDISTKLTTWIGHKVVKSPLIEWHLGEKVKMSHQRGEAKKHLYVTVSQRIFLTCSCRFLQLNYLFQKLSVAGYKSILVQKLFWTFSMWIKCFNVIIFLSITSAIFSYWRQSYIYQVLQTLTLYCGTQNWLCVHNILDHGLNHNSVNLK